VKDGKGQKLAAVYYEEEPGRRSAAKLLTRDEAQRIAANVATGQNSDTLCDRIGIGQATMAESEVEEAYRLACDSSLHGCWSPFPGNGILRAETVASKSPVTHNRTSAETKRPHEDPPVRRYLHDPGKSLFG
jgi:hypothetical protein